MERQLLLYLPMVLAKTAEMKAIMNTEQVEIDKMWRDVSTFQNDLFATTATEMGLSRMEKILSIVTRPTEPLPDRRFRVIARLSEELPFTEVTLRRQLSALCGEGGFDVTISPNSYTLDVKVALVAKSNFEDVRALLRRVTPANIVITLTLKYNKHSVLHSFTYGALRQYTYKGIRDEVIKNGN